MKAMHITEADREFGRSIVDVAINLSGEVRDPLSWVADMAAGRGPDEQSRQLLRELRLILAPVLKHGAVPNDSLRARCTEAYTHWLASL